MYVYDGVYTLYSLHLPPPPLPQVLMTNHELSIPAPLFVTWFQCLFTVGLCYLCGELGEIQRKKGKAAYFTQFPAMRYNYNVASKISILSIVSDTCRERWSLCMYTSFISIYTASLYIPNLSLSSSSFLSNTGLCRYGHL